jgi:hypothetical protein
LLIAPNKCHENADDIIVLVSRGEERERWKEV